MNKYPNTISIYETATEEQFNEKGYLLANPDVAQAVIDGVLPSGFVHFKAFGRNEGRMQRSNNEIIEAKRRKQELILPLLRDELPHQKREGIVDFLSAELRNSWNITETAAVSSNRYDTNMLTLIDKYKNGFVLDAGAGSRDVYFSNVINFEIVPYESTDVLGVGEILPFKDGSMDAVISNAVLEHVKDPFLCAKEIIRVLKPGGELICCVPFLQPYHGYPHHYYNMTHQGLRNLFENSLVIDKIEVLDSTSPIWTLTWFLGSWSRSLPENTRKEFLNMRVSDLIKPAVSQLNESYVTELPMETRFELASACVLFAHKS